MQQHTWRRETAKPRRFRPALEALEDRLAPAIFDIANFDVPGLIAAINTANANGEADTINLAPGGSYLLTAGSLGGGGGANGLPTIAEDGGKPLAISGNGATIVRSPDAPAFRLVEVGVGGKLTLDRVTLANGNTSVSGGGILVNTGGKLILSNSAVVNNTALGEAGGGIYIFVKASATIVNSTISGNSAFDGGGVSLNGSTVTILNSTIAGNIAVRRGGGIDFQFNTPSLTLESTLVADNTAPTGADLARLEGTVNATRSLVESPQDGAINGTNTDNVLGQDAQLGQLQNNGGPTPTHALLPGSTAIDRGSNLVNLAVDQRGADFSRVNGAAADIGAFETLVAPPPAPTPPAPPTPLADNNVSQPADVTAQVAVRLVLARFDPVTGTTTLQLRLRNRGPTALTGPISLVLIGLPRGIKLLSRTGVTTVAPSGLPFQNLRLGTANRVQVTASGAVVISLGGGVNQLLAGDARTIQLVFKNLAGAPFRFQWRILAGAGAR